MEHQHKSWKLFDQYKSTDLANAQMQKIEVGDSGINSDTLFLDLTCNTDSLGRFLKEIWTIGHSHSFFLSFLV